MPCHKDINIQLILVTKSTIKRMSFETATNFLEKAIKKAQDCTECRKCTKKCPYALDIPVLLKENVALWENYKNEFLNNN
jgi:predicted aldo/keto reductase-like oxidoreductase